MDHSVKGRGGGQTWVGWEWGAGDRRVVRPQGTGHARHTAQMQSGTATATGIAGRERDLATRNLGGSLTSPLVKEARKCCGSLYRRIMLYNEHAIECSSRLVTTATVPP